MIKVTIHKELILPKYWISDEDYIEIAVIDDGPGIPDEIFEKLFKKVQSTKSGEHSGLGLSIVRSLVQELNGKISCRTMKNKGTIFHVLLPKKY